MAITKELNLSLETQRTKETAGKGEKYDTVVGFEPSISAFSKKATMMKHVTLDTLNTVESVSKL